MSNFCEKSDFNHLFILSTEPFVRNILFILFGLKNQLLLIIFIYFCFEKKKNALIVFSGKYLKINLTNKIVQKEKGKKEKTQVCIRNNVA